MQAPMIKTRDPMIQTGKTASAIIKSFALWVAIIFCR
jgi:hypothetical protein